MKRTPLPEAKIKVPADALLIQSPESPVVERLLTVRQAITLIEYKVVVCFAAVRGSRKVVTGCKETYDGWSAGHYELLYIETLLDQRRVSCLFDSACSDNDANETPTSIIHNSLQGLLQLCLSVFRHSV